MNHRILRLPRHPRLIKNGWIRDPDMVNVPKVIVLKSGEGKAMTFQFPDHFVWCYRKLGPISPVPKGLTLSEGK